MFQTAVKRRRASRRNSIEQVPAGHKRNFRAQEIAAAWRRDRMAQDSTRRALVRFGGHCGEIQAGIELTRRHDSSKAQQIEEWLDQIEASYQVLSMDMACFREWGRLRIRKPTPLLEDAMIAATARTHNLTVATRNERDFRQFDVAIVNPFNFTQ